MLTFRNEDEVLNCAAKIVAERQGYPSDNAQAAMGKVSLGRGGALLSDASSPSGPTNEFIVSNHSPDIVQLQRITTIRAAARNFLDAIDANCGHCTDATAAKRKVREAMMTANAAIALDCAI